MKKIIKHKLEDCGKIFFSSDWHNFHDPKSWDTPIWKMRGYSSPEESRNDVIERLNVRVGESDILYYMGDGFLNATDEQCLEWLSQINCRTIYYINGNHESNMSRLYDQECVKQYGIEGVEIYPLRMGNVVFIGNYQEIYIGKQQIICCHYPISSHHNAGRGSWGLSGHTHGNYNETLPRHPISKRLDCSWDIKKDVWSFDEICDVMSTKDIYAPDHHV